MKKITAFALVCCLVLSTTFSAFAEAKKGTMPQIYFEYCGIKPLPDTTAPNGGSYTSLVNDLFYIQYPGSWSFGTSNVCPIVFYNDSETQKTTYEFQDFQDAALIGSEDAIDFYVQGGGINSYLEQVLGLRDFSDLTYSVHHKGDTVLIYSLDRGEETIASVIIWTSFGKLSIRDERSNVSINPERDYGDIMVFPVWDTEDFSSIEAIQNFVNAGKLNSYLDPCEGTVTWSSTKVYDTAKHQYLLCEGTSELLKLSVYIPVLEPGKKKWIVGFDVYKESKLEINAYSMQADIISTFKVLK